MIHQYELLSKISICGSEILLGGEAQLTLPVLESNTDWNSIFTTLQDAINVTSKLGIEYLWIVSEVYSVDLFAT